MKLLATYLTLKELEVEVSPLMVFLVTVRDKGLATEATDERLLSGVGLDMVLVAR